MESHRILASLRPTQEHATLSANKVRERVSFAFNLIVRVQYKIPQGGWFEHVSGPHYFAEIMLYFGLVVVRRFALSQLYVARCNRNLTIRDFPCRLTWVWVTTNLLITARRTHQWYRTKFDNYPKQRKALVPFLY